MSIELRFVCAMLAAWRLTHLLTAEDGPGDVVVHLRVRLGDSMAGKAMDCFYCLSVWIAAPLALFVVHTDVVSWIVTWLALSGGACLLDRIGNRSGIGEQATVTLSESRPHEPAWTAPPRDSLGVAAEATDAHITNIERTRAGTLHDTW